MQTACPSPSLETLITTFSFPHSSSQLSVACGEPGSTAAGACNFLSQGHRWLCLCTRKTTASGPRSSHQTPRSPSHIQITLTLCLSPLSYWKTQGHFPRKSPRLYPLISNHHLLETSWCVDRMLYEKSFRERLLARFPGRFELACVPDSHDPAPV